MPRLMRHEPRAVNLGIQTNWVVKKQQLIVTIVQRNPEMSTTWALKTNHDYLRRRKQTLSLVNGQYRIKSVVIISFS